jgi:hypothetical protein
MADTQSKELKVREKQEVASPAEQTTPGLVFTPAVDIFETEKEITLLADMPGVKADVPLLTIPTRKKYWLNMKPADITDSLTLVNLSTKKTLMQS